MIRLILRALRVARDFFVQWFLPLPPLDTFEEKTGDEEKEDENDTATSSVDEGPVDAPSEPDISPPDPEVEIRPPEGAESRSPRGMGTINPFID